MFSFNDYDFICVLSHFSAMGLGLILVICVWVQALSGKDREHVPLISLFAVTFALLVNVCQSLVHNDMNPFADFHLRVGTSFFCFLAGIVCLVSLHLRNSRASRFLGVVSYFFLAAGFGEFIGTIRGNTAIYYGW
jgi:hypothetical protein